MATGAELFKQRYQIQSSDLSNAEKFKQLMLLDKGTAAAPAPTQPNQPARQPAAPALTQYMAPTAPAPSNLWSQYQPRLDTANQQSQQLLEDYLMMAAQAPTFEQKLLDEIKRSEQYPSHAALREEYMQNPNLTPMAIESLVSRRGQSTRGTIQDIINRAYGGFQADVASKQAAAQLGQQERQNLLEEYGLAYESQQDRLTGAGGSGTTSERYTARTREAAAADVRNWMTAKDFATKYGGTLDDWELMNVYNQNSPYGPMKESPATFKNWITSESGTDVMDQEAISAYAEMIVNGEITLSNVPADYRAEVTKLVSQMQGQDQGGTGFLGKLGQIIGSIF
jgi:hypothetical protein